MNDAEILYLLFLYGDTQIVGLVMKLTGGSANPAVVQGQIERLRSEHERGATP